MEVPINITGGSSQHQSRQLSNQRTVNFYPELVDTKSAKSEYVLNAFPGLKLFSTGTEPDRGAFEFEGVLYVVNGTTLYSVDSSGARTGLTTIPGTGRCVMEGIGNNLIIVSGGRVWVYIAAPDITNMRYTEKYFSVFDMESQTNGFTLKPDGTKFYIVGNVNNTVYEYELSVPWDITTASYLGSSYDVSSQESNPTEVRFKPDGIRMFVLGTANDAVYQYTLSVAWDVSSATYDSVSYSVNSEETVPYGLEFKPDGTEMYIVGQGNDTIYQYTLRTPWDVSTASFTAGDLLDVSSEDVVPISLAFESDGLTVYVTGSENDSVYEYTLSTAWDIKTGSYSSKSHSIASEDTIPFGILSAGLSCPIVRIAISDPAARSTAPNITKERWPNKSRA